MLRLANAIPEADIAVFPLGYSDLKTVFAKGYLNLLKEAHARGLCNVEAQNVATALVNGHLHLAGWTTRNLDVNGDSIEALFSSSSYRALSTRRKLRIISWLNEYFDLDRWLRVTGRAASSACVVARHPMPQESGDLGLLFDRIADEARRFGAENIIKLGPSETNPREAEATICYQDRRDGEDAVRYLPGVFTMLKDVSSAPRPAKLAPRTSDGFQSAQVKELQAIADLSLDSNTASTARRGDHDWSSSVFSLSTS
jgi:hypothetical protein